MSPSCCNHTADNRIRDRRYRRVLWAVLGINAAMFLIEVVAGLTAGSASLQDSSPMQRHSLCYGLTVPETAICDPSGCARATM
jgi:Co/Zn/Cd efflux system component